MRAREQAEDREIEKIGDILARGWAVTDERHPRIRTGDRQPIPRYVRTAVWCRDRGRCDHCGGRVPEGSRWELDHIIPWSAGGSNDSTNLRVLCEAHNQLRSNYVDPTERPRRPVTWWCVNCFIDADPVHWYGDRPLWCDAHENYGWCRIVGGSQITFDATGQWPDPWFRREPIRHEDAVTVAYCAHCDTVALTDHVL